MSYYDVYRKRLNRFGTNPASRIQGQREQDFENYLLRTPYRVDFTYETTEVAAALEPSKQDETRTVQYLLTRLNVNLPNGFVFEVTDKDLTTNHWMIWWKENSVSSGYNKYVVLRASHLICWKGGDVLHQQWGYFYGPGQSKIRAAIQSDKTGSVFSQDDNLRMFITKWDKSIAVGTYFTITEGETTLGYSVTGYDLHSTTNIGYVSVDPVYVRDQTPPPVPPVSPTPEQKQDYYWISGGNVDGNT